VKLNTRALEILACLPLADGEGGADIMAIGEDVLGDPLYGDPQPCAPHEIRKANITRTLMEIRAASKSELGADVLVCTTLSTARNGHRRRYSLTSAGMKWAWKVCNAQKKPTG